MSMPTTVKCPHCGHLVPVTMDWCPCGHDHTVPKNHCRCPKCWAKANHAAVRPWEHREVHATKEVQG